MYARAEGAEDGGHLCASGTRAHDEDGLRHLLQAPGIAVRGRQFCARNSQSPAHATGTEDELSPLQAQPAAGFNGVRINETRITGIFMQSDAQSIDVLTQYRMA